MALGVVAGDRVGDRLHDHGLAGLRRGHDQTTLALADRRDQVDDPGRQTARLTLQAQSVLRVKGRQLPELRPSAALFGRHAVDRVEADQRVELLAPLAVLGLADRAGDVVTLAQTALTDLGERDIDVVRAGQVAGGPDERIVVEDVQDARDRDQDVVLGHLRLVAEVLTAAATAPAVAVAAATAPAAALEVVVVIGTAVPLALAALAALTALAAAVTGVALAAAVAAVALALATVTAVTLLAAVLAVAAVLAGPALAGLLRGHRGVGLGVRLDLGLRLDLGVGLEVAGGGLGAARGGGGAAPAALAGRLLVAHRLAGDVDLLLGPGLVRGLAALVGLGCLAGGLLRTVVAGAGLGGRPALGLGLGIGGRVGLGGGPEPPACFSLMTSISWLLRIRAVPLIPRPEATCCSSARTMPSRPVPERRRRAGAAGASVAGAVALPSVRAPIRSVVSLTKGPSLERASACLARRPVVLSGWVLGLVDRCRGGGPAGNGGEISSWRRREEMQSGSCRHADSGACSHLLRPLLRAVWEAPGRKWSLWGTRSTAPLRRRVLT